MHTQLDSSDWLQRCRSHTMQYHSGYCWGTSLGYLQGYSAATMTGSTKHSGCKSAFKGAPICCCHSGSVLYDTHIASHGGSGHVPEQNLEVVYNVVRGQAGSGRGLETLVGTPFVLVYLATID